MQVNIGPIKDQKGGELTFSFREDWSNLEMGGKGLGFVEFVDFNGKVSWTGECFLVKGKAKAKMQMTCARCLESNIAPVQADILEEFRHAQQDSHDHESEAEWEDEDVQEFRGLVLRLDEVVLENLLLSVPIKSLCKDDCHGLCPQCGHNLNEGKCDCVIDDINPKMDILRKLLEPGN